MTDYDYTLKVMLLGEESSPKTALTHQYVSGYFAEDLKLTIGVDFYSKTVNFEEQKVKMQIWDFGGEERFRFLLSQYCRGADGAIFLYDITNRNTLNHLSDWIQIMRENAGDIPIVLAGNKLDLEESRNISYDEGLQVSRDSNLSGFLEVSGKTGENVEELFNLILHSMIQTYTSRIRQGLIKPECINGLEFRVNEYLDLKLRNAKTNIYVGGKLINQCKYLLLNIPSDKIRDYDEIESIDEAAEMLDSSMERGRSNVHYISPDTEFWGHCSNLQAWYENDYDTRMLHRNLAFTLLKALVEVGDPIAKKVFKEEIALRLESGYPSVVLHLINQYYLKYLTKGELNTILENPDFIKNLSKWHKHFKHIPKWLLEKIKAKLKDLKCPYCSMKIPKALSQKILSGKSIKCEYCYSNII